MHTALFAECRVLAAEGVRIVMSNADVSLVRDAFSPPEWTTEVIECRRSINSRNPEAKTNEVLTGN